VTFQLNVKPGDLSPGDVIKVCVCLYTYIQQYMHTQTNILYSQYICTGDVIPKITLIHIYIYIGDVIRDIYIYRDVSVEIQARRLLPGGRDQG